MARRTNISSMTLILLKKSKIISVKLGNLELVAGSDELDKYQLDDSQFANDKNKWMLSGFYRYRVYFYRHFM